MTLYTRLGGWGIRGRPPETSPCPSPSHRPGEGDSDEAVVPIGSAFAALPMLKMPPTSTTAPTESPSPGRWEGDGRGDRGEVPGGGRPVPGESPQTGLKSGDSMVPSADRIVVLLYN